MPEEEFDKYQRKIFATRRSIKGEKSLQIANLKKFATIAIPRINHRNLGSTPSKNILSELRRVPRIVQYEVFRLNKVPGRNRFHSILLEGAKGVIDREENEV